MKSIPDMYWHEISSKFSRLPVWLPGTPIDLGDVGYLSPERWTKVTTLRDLGFEVVPDKVGVSTEYDYSSAQGARVTTNVTATTSTSTPGAAVGEAGFSVAFTRAGACVFKVARVMVHRIANLDSLDQWVLNTYAKGMWKPDWTYVTEVARGGPSCVLVADSDSASATVDFAAEAHFAPAAAASARGGFALGSNHGLAGGFVTSARTTVLWSGRYVRDPMFRAARVDERGNVKEPPAPAVEGAPKAVAVEYVTDNLRVADGFR